MFLLFLLEQRKKKEVIIMNYHESIPGLDVLVDIREIFLMRSVKVQEVRKESGWN